MLLEPVIPAVESKSLHLPLLRSSSRRFSTRKSKCDGKQPVCRACADSGHEVSLPPMVIPQPLTDPSSVHGPRRKILVDQLQSNMSNHSRIRTSFRLSRSRCSRHSLRPLGSKQRVWVQKDLSTRLLDLRVLDYLVACLCHHRARPTHPPDRTPRNCQQTHS